MNAKTTLILLVLLVAAGGTFYMLKSREAAEARPGLESAPLPPETGTARDLLTEKPGDIVKIVVKRSSGPEWVFEKDTSTEAGVSAAASWKMTAPVAMAVTGYEVDRIGRQLSGLRYELSFKPGTPGAVTAADAGLAPPELTVMLTDASGKTFSIDVGRARSESQTYVRLTGSDTIVAAETSLKNLVKEKPIEYRDLQLWNFPAEKVTRVEIDDRATPGKTVQYVFVKDGGKWVMQSPVAAKATGKVDEMLKILNRLRANKWEDDRKERLAAYGLDPAAWSIRATVVEEVAKPAEAAPDEGEKAEAAAPETKTTVYELHLSAQSPIGDEAKAFIRTGTDSAVGTIAKVSADKFKPVMSEWRDMHVTTANVNEATRIELNIQGEKAILAKTAGRWKFEPDGAPAEDAAVRAMLKSLADLTATSFTDGEPTDPGSLGMVNPQAELRLTIAGSEEPERITIGGYTDATSKRLVYVRRNEVASVAKVRAAEIANLTQNPRAYRDRTILDVHADRFEKITLTLANPDIAASGTTTFERTDGTWTMTAPLAASVRADRMDALVSALGALRAESIVADEGELTAFGLDAPTVRVSFTYKPPVQYKIEPKPEGEQQPDGEAKADQMVTKEVQPPSETIEVLVTQHDGKFYAKRADRPTIYQINGDAHQKLCAELRSGELMGFDDKKVKRFSLRSGDVTHTFERKDDKWMYGPEPDLPLDTTKVNNLLLQLKDIRTERFVSHDTTDLAAFGLAAPSQDATVTLDDGTQMTLLMSSKPAEKGKEPGNLAAVKDRPGVFLLSPDTVNRLKVVLQDLEAGKKP